MARPVALFNLWTADIERMNAALPCARRLHPGHALAVRPPPGALLLSRTAQAKVHVGSVRKSTWCALCFARSGCLVSGGGGVAIGIAVAGRSLLFGG